jgi:hypothetical protein
MDKEVEKWIIWLDEYESGLMEVLKKLKEEIKYV